MKELFRKKHELFLSMIFGAFSIKDEKLYEVFYDFALIEYRHLSWLGNYIKEEKKEFDYDIRRKDVKFMAENNFELFSNLKDLIQKMSYPKGEMFDRFKSDEEFFVKKIDYLLSDEKNNAQIEAFNKSRKLDGYDLDEISTNALIQFLFEETYKEYELIMVYTYSNIYTDSKVLSSIFVDLIYESIFHLKSFARMLSKMGLLYLPRQIMKEVYQFDDLGQFLLDGIKEEEAAKEECVKLSQAVQNEELSNFFNFINNQESYHIELMKKALKEIS